MEKKKFNKLHLLWIIPVALIAALTIAFLIFAANYYRAGDAALAALSSDDQVQVSATGYGWFFDGPSDENAFVFYPGANVEETAYAPLLHKMAEEGLDVCLVSMPWHFAFFDVSKASSVMEQYEYSRWFIGGHSLGGAMAESYTSKHGDEVDGVILLGAHATQKLDNAVFELVIYGTEDGLATKERIEAGRETAPEHYFEHAIEGGNHAQFGDYGKQSGDGEALISAGEQWEEMVGVVLDTVENA